MDIKKRIQKIKLYYQRLSYKAKGLLIGIAIGILAIVAASIGIYYFEPLMFVALPTIIVSRIWWTIAPLPFDAIDYFVIVNFIVTPVVYGLVGFFIGYLIDKRRIKRQTNSKGM